MTQAAINAALERMARQPAYTPFQEQAAGKAVRNYKATIGWDEPVQPPLGSGNRSSNPYFDPVTQVNGDQTYSPTPMQKIGHAEDVANAASRRVALDNYDLKRNY
jgi:hypothetical protein